MEGALHDDQGRNGKGKGDIEVPAPPDPVGDDAAYKGATDGSARHDGAEQAHIATAFAGADDVGHDHLAECG